MSVKFVINAFYGGAIRRGAAPMRYISETMYFSVSGNAM